MKLLSLLITLSVTMFCGNAMAGHHESGEADKKKEGWAQFDTDGDGALNVEEYSQLEVAQLSALDRNGDGEWTRREYVKRAPNMSAGRLDALRGRFKRSDTNEDEVLDTAEASKSIEKRFLWLDKNKNGKIEPKEFPKFW